jgi:hypothetical protein
MELRDGWLRFTLPDGVSLASLAAQHRHHNGSVGFYSQDWYLGEPFTSFVVPAGAYRLRVTPIPETRAKHPAKALRLLPKRTEFPSAGLVAWAFFAAFRQYHVKLWPLEYVWCSDHDANGDQVYVGGYELGHHPGFQVHRHLSLRNCHAAIPMERL